MKILLINKYLFRKGGAEASTFVTGDLLKANGHEVYFWGMAHHKNFDLPFQDLFPSRVDYEKNNGLISSAIAAANILYSFEAKKKLAKLLDIIQPDLVHMNNIYHQLSPSILPEIKNRRIPMVMTLRDYKVVCPAYSMVSKGKVCEKCKNGQYYHCGLNKCTKGSLLKSMVNVAEMYLHHTFLKLYENIDTFISPSRFLISKVKEMGLKKEILHLFNCVDISEYSPSFNWEENSIVYVGRISHEKGIQTLIKAVKDQNLILKIVGDGPLKIPLEKKNQKENIKNVKFLGYRSGQDLQNEIKKSMFLVIPSEWYENNPRSVIEAFALGKPVLGARIGGISELVKDWKTGFNYISGDTKDLRSKIIAMVKHKELIPQMGQNARNFVEKELNTDTHYQKLLKIYQNTISMKK